MTGDPFEILSRITLEGPPDFDPDDEEDGGEPIIKPATGYDAFLFQRYAPQPEQRIILPGER